MSTTDTTAPAQRPRGATKSSFTLPAIAARDLVNGILPAASKDGVTPVLCAAQWIVEKDSVRLVATDRYRVHTAIAEHSGKAKAGKFLVPRSALLWLSKNANYFGRHRRGLPTKPVVDVVLATDADGSGAVTFVVRSAHDAADDAISFTAALVKGNFPPVLDLVEKARAAEILEGRTPRVNLTFLGASEALANSERQAPTLKFTSAEPGSQKPGPLLVTFTSYDKVTYAEALIQPNLELR